MKRRACSSITRTTLATARSVAGPNTARSCSSLVMTSRKRCRRSITSSCTVPPTVWFASIQCATRNCAPTVPLTPYFLGSAAAETPRPALWIHHRRQENARSGAHCRGKRNLAPPNLRSVAEASSGPPLPGSLTRTTDADGAGLPRAAKQRTESRKHIGSISECGCRRMLGDHHRGEAGVGARYDWHDRSVHDAQAGDTAHAAERVDDCARVVGPAHSAGAGGMEHWRNAIEELVDEAIIPAREDERTGASDSHPAKWAVEQRSDCHGRKLDP